MFENGGRTDDKRQTRDEGRRTMGILQAHLVSLTAQVTKTNQNKAGGPDRSVSNNDYLQ